MGNNILCLCLSQISCEIIVIKYLILSQIITVSKPGNQLKYANLHQISKHPVHSIAI